MSLNWTGERLVTTVREIGVIEHLQRYAIACDLVKGRTVLDIASGEGYGSNLLAKSAKNVIGIDISKEAVAHASKKYIRENLEFKIGSCTSIPLAEKSVEIVVSFETLEHILEHEIFIKEIKRVLSHDGILIISTPERSNLGDKENEKNKFHLKELYFSEFEMLIQPHFKNYKFLFQKSIFGTLIVPENFSFGNFVEYSGNFEEIISSRKISNPTYNICIASDFEIPHINLSFFDGQELYDRKIIEITNQILAIKKSKNYQFGKLVLSPFRFIYKKLLK